MKVTNRYHHFVQLASAQRDSSNQIYLLNRQLLIQLCQPNHQCAYSNRQTNVEERKIPKQETEWNRSRFHRFLFSGNYVAKMVN